MDESTQRYPSFARESVGARKKGASVHVEHGHAVVQILEVLPGLPEPILVGFAIEGPRAGGPATYVNAAEAIYVIQALHAHEYC